MCIVLLTTAHPDYALIVLDNRDEFILRPTSRPHWWTPSRATASDGTEPNGTAHGTVNGVSNRASHGDSKPAVQEILSSRDLQRDERGTWIGVTKAGNFAVLTNYRETDTSDAAHPVCGTRSRGAIVTAWLTASPAESTADFVQRMLRGGEVKGVGGFSLICGKLRRAAGMPRRIQPLAVISNRNESADEVPWICADGGQIYGLSNASFLDGPKWPKVETGIRLVKEAVKLAVSEGMDEEHLMETLFGVLDTDTLPVDENASFEDSIPVLKHSIFIPAIGDKEHKLAMDQAVSNGDRTARAEMPEGLKVEERPDAKCPLFETGMYGTQRQTIVLVDWQGNVTYRERPLWDAYGNKVPRGAADMTFKFKVQGWQAEPSNTQL